MVEKPLVIWSKRADQQLQKAYQDIKEDSPANAVKVRDEILATTRELADYPEKYPPDKFKRSNPGNYRAFEKYSFRVSYRFSPKEVRILRIRHVRKEPKPY